MGRKGLRVLHVNELEFCFNNLGYCPCGSDDRATLCLKRCSRPLCPPRLANSTNSLRRCHANRRSRCGCRRLLDTSRWPNTNRDIRVASPLLSLNNDERITETSHWQTSSYPRLVMIIKRDGSTSPISPPNRPILTQIAVVLRPELIYCTITGVVPIERLCGVIRGIMLCESLHHVELYSRVARKSVKGEIRISLRVVVGSVVDDAT